MKKLSIEDKAKRYDEAIEELKGMIPSWELLSYNGKTFLQDLFYILPELEESEDERIRKWIKKELESKYVVDNIVNNVIADKALAWLEKQGEQKPAWSEDDEKMIEAALQFAHEYGRHGLWCWLKSLSPQPNWMPTKEEKDALLWCIANLEGENQRILDNFLKKIMML